MWSTPFPRAPRGSRRKGADYRAAGLGDCIDCTLCVQVCPTGIDIREGLQIECIACGACIDACDAVMDKMGYPRGLIRYTTENMLAGRPRRIVRPRTAIYALILAALLGAFAWGVGNRQPLIVDVLHDRNALYREVAGGDIENGYTLKLVNKTDRALRLRVEIEDEPNLHIAGASQFEIGAGQVANVPLTLHATADAGLQGRHHVELGVRSSDESIHIEHKTQFFAPEAK